MHEITTEEVIAVHQAIAVFAEDTGDPISPVGVRDHNLLESAVSRQNTGFAGEKKYSQAWEIAATLLFGICNDHPFYNGNKRTALVTTLVYLEKNGYIPDGGTTHKDFEDLVLATASHQLLAFAEHHKLLREQIRRLRKEKEEHPHFRLDPDREVLMIGEWLRQNIRLQEKRERVLTLRQLRVILRRFGCSLEVSGDNKLNITRNVIRRGKGLFGRTRSKEEGLWVQLNYYRESQTIDIPSMRHIRTRLELTPEHGVDSRSFYDEAAIVNSLLNEYTQVLKRLARK